MASAEGIERILKRDRLVVIAALAVIIAASWAYVLAGAGTGMSGLIAILFFGGIINLYWIIGLALLVLVEKALPHGLWIGRVTGAAPLAGSGVIFGSAAGAF